MTDRYENIRKALADMDTAAESRNALAWGDAHARLSAHVAPNTIRVLLAERDALAQENEAMRRCAIKYLGWLDIVYGPLDKALREDMANPDMCGDAAIDAAIDRARRAGGGERMTDRQVCNHRQWPPGPTLKDLTREMTADDIAVGVAAQELSADALDAARYRWLRVRWGRITETFGTEPEEDGWGVSPESLDAAIASQKGGPA